MNDTLDVANLINSLVYIVPLVSLTISVVTFSNAAKERTAKTAMEAAEVKAELHTLSEQVEELKEMNSEVSKGYHNNDKRIEVVETRLHALEKRVLRLEQVIRND